MGSSHPGTLGVSLLPARAPDLGRGGGGTLPTESGILRRKMRSKDVVDCLVSNHKVGHEPESDYNSDFLLLIQTLLSSPHQLKGIASGML